MSGKPKGVRCITPKFRANWVFLFEPKKATRANQKPRYSITCLFEKGQDLSEMNKLILQAGKEMWGDNQKKWPKLSYLPIKDQGTALRKNDEGEEYLPPGYEAGAKFMQAHTYTPPGVIGPDKAKILDPDEVYSGCYMRASVVFKAYDVDGQRGVSCYLQNVQKIADGERLGGRVLAEDEFSAIEGSEAAGDSSTDELADLL